MKKVIFQEPSKEHFCLLRGNDHMLGNIVSLCPDGQCSLILGAENPTGASPMFGSQIHPQVLCTPRPLTRKEVPLPPPLRDLPLLLAPSLSPWQRIASAVLSSFLQPLLFFSSGCFHRHVDKLVFNILKKQMTIAAKMNYLIPQHPLFLTRCSVPLHSKTLWNMNPFIVFTPSPPLPPGGAAVPSADSLCCGRWQAVRCLFQGSRICLHVTQTPRNSQRSDHSLICQALFFLFLFSVTPSFPHLLSTFCQFLPSFLCSLLWPNL